MKKKSIETFCTVILLSVICGYLFYLFPKKMWLLIPVICTTVFVLAYFDKPWYKSKLLQKSTKAITGIDDQEEAYPAHFLLIKELKIIRSLARMNVILFIAAFDTGVTVKLQNPQVTKTIKKILADARISGQDKDIEHLQIQIHTKNKNFSYTASVQAYNKDDVILKFPECGDYGGIRLPGLKLWLDQNTLKKE